MDSGAIGLDGWHRRSIRIASPNADARPLGVAVELIVIHNISLPPGCFGGRAVAQLFTNCLDPGAHPYFARLTGLRVSAHFHIDRNGVLTQFVSTARRAWHAGASIWRARCNDFSTGIELEGTDDLLYTALQYRRLAALTRALRLRHPTIAGVAGHSEIAPGRKTDPGPSFDWQRYVLESSLPQRFRNLT